MMVEADHFARWDAAGTEHRERVFADFTAFMQAVGERGSIVAGEALDRPASGHTVRAATDGGTRQVVEGPYAETVEQLGGFYVIDVADQATALELAALLPHEYDVEVRPVLEVDF